MHACVDMLCGTLHRYHQPSLGIGAEYQERNVLYESTVPVAAYPLRNVKDPDVTCLISLFSPLISDHV
jgi:hypothetical protein